MSNPKSNPIAIIGAGPAGLIAAERLAGRGYKVTVFERMPSVGRKLLMAGRGGLNLTHSEPLDALLNRYRPHQGLVDNAIRAFPPAELIEWVKGLGQETFTGSSGRVFPKSLKASPLLRAWLRRLASLGVEIRTGQRWTGWSQDGALTFIDTKGVTHTFKPAATLLALGGASWPRLGSDGGWAEILSREGVAIEPLLPANAGVRIPWSDYFKSRFAGEPLKRIAVSFNDIRRRGEAVITKSGLEGGVIYSFTPQFRSVLGAGVTAMITLDLRPDAELADLAQRLGAPRGKQSMANTLRKAAHLSPAAISVLREGAPKGLPTSAMDLAHLIKHVTLPIEGVAGLERAISSAGGIRFDAIDAHFMLKARPGVFAAGEMLDWEAPTGGYLLQAVMATGVAASDGVVQWLHAHSSSSEY